MISSYLPLLYSILAIIWIDIVLSGDNALVIALVCEELPPAQRRLGIFFGSLGAIATRLALLFVAALVLTIPGVHVVGGLFLFYVALKMLIDHASDDENKKPSESLLSAIVTIIAADLMLSVDNVIAITAAAKGNFWLTAFGIAVSMPIMFFGASLLAKLIERFPVMVYIGAALVAWVGFTTVIDEPFITGYLTAALDGVPLVKSILGL
jgi:YjbE family integral membrane protein